MKVVVEARIDIVHLANVAKLLKERGYVPTSQSSLIATAIGLLSQLSKNSVTSTKEAEKLLSSLKLTFKRRRNLRKLAKGLTLDDIDDFEKKASDEAERISEMLSKE